MPITQQTLDFLVENRIRDSRDWYQAHRAQFKALVEAPMLELSQAVGPIFAAIDPAIVTAPRRTVSRIWRDTRFSRDKTLFRDVMWLVFRRGKGMAYPSFYFEFSPGGYRTGCGYYSTPPPVAEALRQWVIRDDRRWLAAQAAIEALPGCTLHGERFKRPRYTEYPSEKQAWLNLRSFVAGRSTEALSALFSLGLADELVQNFEALAPVYHLLLDAHLQVMGPDE